MQPRAQERPPAGQLFVGHLRHPLTVYGFPRLWGSPVGQRRRRRGEVDPHLAISRAKIEDAETFEEAVGYLNQREKFSVLNAPAVLSALLALQGAKSD